MEEILNQLNEIRKLYDEDSKPPRTRKYQIGGIRFSATSMLPKGTAIVSDDVMCLLLDLMDELKARKGAERT